MSSRDDRAARSSARSFSALPFPGGGSSDNAGLSFVPDNEEWVIAKLTEAPDGTHPGYSWVEQVAVASGVWADRDANDRRDGSNGITTTRVNVAYPFNPSDTFPVGTIVLMVRGYQHGDDEAGAPGQEWSIVRAAGGGGGNVSILRIDAGVAGGGADTGNNFATGPNGEANYFAWVQDITLSNGVSPPDSAVGVALAFYYQTPIWAASYPLATPSRGQAYSGIYAGRSITVTFNFGELGDLEVTLPQYWSAWSPPDEVCNDTVTVNENGTS